MPPSYICDLADCGSTVGIGAKAERLRLLLKRGFRIPTTFVCVWDAYLRYLEGDAELLTILASQLREAIVEDRLYAVRSSANVEDDLEHSFAGQFQTLLNVRGIDAIVEGMQSIWAETQSPGVQAYLQKNAIDPGSLKMAIVIQDMVCPRVSGVSFSKNPITGMDEIIVEAVHGSGEALVQEGATPQRWVNKWGVWTARPEQDDIELELIQEVVRGTKAIARAYGQPVDLEWVYDGQQINWVQMREITALNIPVYSNRISSEVFPGLIKPLVWSVNVPLVNGAWVRLFTELIGPNDIDAESLAKLFYYRAYFNMGALGQVFEMLGQPRETLELLMGIEVEGPEMPSFRPNPKMYALLPRMLGFAVGKVRFGRKLEAALPKIEEQYQGFSGGQVGQWSEGELLEAIERHFAAVQETAYYNIVTPLLMQIYNRLLKGQLRRSGVDYESFDLMAGMDRLEQYEPYVHLARLHEEYSALDPVLKARIGESDYSEFCRLSGIGGFQERVAEFIARFGHLSDSGNDFSFRPWRENPDLILNMIVNYAPAAIRSRRKVRLGEVGMPALRKLLVRPVYRRARRFGFYREAVSSLYTLGYGRFRDYFLALGDHFARRAVLSLREDIFYLYFDEVKAIIRDQGATHQVQQCVAERKRELEQMRDIIPPSIIYGDQAPSVEAPDGTSLRGIPTSRGHYTGPVKVLRGLQDFDRLGEGDVLVIPYSDVGWTPLFAKAGAVVAESGGILSHSSIVAREYGIPAVVSVSGACGLEDCTLVTVDGYRGEVVIHKQLKKGEE